jgi:hypothetical protein
VYDCRRVTCTLLEFRSVSHVGVIAQSTILAHITRLRFGAGPRQPQPHSYHRDLVANSRGISVVVTPRPTARDSLQLCYNEFPGSLNVITTYCLIARRKERSPKRMSFEKHSSLANLAQRSEYAFKLGLRAGSRNLHVDRLNDCQEGSCVVPTQKPINAANIAESLQHIGR